ncbi:MAG: GIY-YIG nuclease family protein [Theionarchaea archaeon]|nr:GIY-YIG nuclease family protein [Theionarchaea archaeon]MBU6999242.1 GIY-YIG nuclease family protein [Theionarchaea archaeon]MBU7019633.1 GIY-YIG nuclease family protein [Theionarchaea archaeon]MBU7033812.1 GIY-YIG nuclease family protein [Theionarchaea archaeon]MBU7040222.1 GIY-YIG nuclease family protein [Theionarchaea archaeon]
MTFAYVLVIELSQDTQIQVGKLGTIDFQKGLYYYVGSAPSEKRLERHLRKEKKIHWHIDYFLKEARISKIYITRERTECQVAHDIGLPYIEGFGCSDCDCPSHLFYGTLRRTPDLERYY